jgi:hypothetical protein
MIKIPSVIDIEEIKDYFIKNQLEVVVLESKGVDLPVNEMLSQEPYKPDLEDLYRLHRFIIENKRITVMEFGSGWSTMVMAHALRINAANYNKQVKKLRRNDPFKIFSVENEDRFLEISKNRIDKNLKDFVSFSCSEVHMSTFNGRICTKYSNIPLTSPDFIYLDGPDQFNIKGDILGWTTKHKDMMPMASDILSIEHFLTPGTIIVVDGRAANARFLRCNLQRDWDYSYDEKYDQHMFILSEYPLGKYNKMQLEFYKA